MTEPFDDGRPVAPAENDDAALRDYGRQLAIDALLRMALREGPEATPAATTGSSVAAPRRRPAARWRKTWLATLAAVALLVCGGTYIAIVSQRGKEDRQPDIAIARRDDDRPPPAARVLPDAPRTPKGPKEEFPGWKIEPTPGAKYQVVDARRIRLERGELHLVGAGGEGQEPLTIETELGTATAGPDADFLIGALKSEKPEGEGIAMLPSGMLTRVLVLAGMVALATPQGEVSGEAGHLLAVEADEAPTDLAVEATNGFAFDLYGKLARANADEGLFFSPYSLSVALAMAAEGARDETAEEMARVLHFSEAARRVGNDAQAIPFNIALIHTGYASLNRRWNRTKDADAPIRKRIDTLRKQLAEANRQAAALREQKKIAESNKYALRSQELAGELNQLFTQVDQFELRVANALWGEKTYPFRQDYVDTIHRYYSTGGVFPVDFLKNYEAARRRINAWAAEQTYERIPELISQGVVRPEDAEHIRLILTNAIYFKGEWSQVFSEGATKPEDFLLADGGKARTPMMHHGGLWAGYAAFNADGSLFDTPKFLPHNGEKLYPEEGGFLLLEMGYKGDELSMVLIVPQSPDGLPAVESLLTAERWPEMRKALQGRTVDTFVPRFKLDRSVELSRVLQAMGMVRAFEEPGPEGAQFFGMCESDDPDLQLCIGKVVHAAQVDVNEKGTEAAAATAVIIADRPMAMADRPFHPTFRADRPFTFLIRDKKSDTILFMGRMTRP